jgi:lysophospholipase L1-like esterase
MRCPILFHSLIFFILSAQASCTTTSSVPVNTAKLGEVDWSQCVREIPSGPDRATQPFPRIQDFPWMSRNEWCTRVVAIRKDPARAAARLGFMGDSITQMWPQDLWEEKFSAFHPLRMGIGGDRTQTLLWRMDQGELQGLSLKTLVLLIGTNNLGAGDSPDDVTQGIKLTIDQIRTQQPQIRVLLMAIFPREQSPQDPLRIKVKATNALLTAAAKSWGVTLIDIGPQLLEKDGTISRDMMGDFVHLTPKGYRIWADAVLAALKTGPSTW